MPRIGQIMLMLSSPADGEVVNAARAVGRALNAAGKDWHTFAACAEGCLSGQTSSGKPGARRPGPERTRPGSGSWEDWAARDIATELLKVASGMLSAWELDFLNSMVAWE